MNDHGADSSDRVSDLLAEWVHCRHSGEELPLEALCRDEPQLAEEVRAQIERLKQTDWLFDEPADETLCGPADATRHEVREDAVILAKSLSAEELLERVGELQMISDETLAELAREFAGEDGGAAAHLLLDRELLTPFQLEKLCGDRGAELLLGDYVLVERIGEGGMGRVYKALHRSMKRSVALKVIHPRVLDSPNAVARFRREVAAAARLKHPNIVVSHDAGEDEGRNYLVMEYVDGIDLAALVRREGPLPVGRSISYVRQAARALAYAHRDGVVHRDVKPSNLMVEGQSSVQSPESRDGQESLGVVKLLDLGLARLPEVVGQGQSLPAFSLTGSGQVMGTVDYLAPEQARESRQADERSDVYGLGCTLYMLLHGRAVYNGDSIVGRLLAHQNEPVPSLRDGRDDVPPRLDALFQRMVAKRPEDRFQSMDDVLAALDELDEVDTARRFTGLSVPNLLRRRWVWAATALAAAVLWVATDLAAWWTSDAVLERSPVAAIEPIEQPQDRKDPPPPAATPFDKDQARAHQEAWAAHLGVPLEWENSIGMTFRLTPPGEFTMGTPWEKAEALAREASGVYVNAHEVEAPPRRVRLTRAYYMATCEVTQEQYRLVTGKNPSHFRSDGPGRARVTGLDTRSHPVENVSWLDAVAFCNALAEREGRRPRYLLIDGDRDVEVRPSDGYRLPTEAQWEYACRAGCEGDFGFAGKKERITLYAVCHLNSGGRTHAVAQRRPNAFGLYDMHGNVWERCFDHEARYDYLATVDPRGPDYGKGHMVRGGSWDNPPERCRSAMRVLQRPIYKSRYSGFRVMLPVEAVQEGTTAERAP